MIGYDPGVPDGDYTVKQVVLPTSEWNCDACHQPAVDDALNIPHCMNPQCSNFFEVIPNYKY